MEQKSFFGQTGLTSTSANHYANLAKEAVRKLHIYLVGTRFFATKMSVIGSEDGGIVKTGCEKDDFSGIKQSIAIISDLHSLIAYFREAIKEKERLAQEALNWKDKDRHADFDTRYSELQSAKPVRKEYLTEDDVLASWTVGEQEKYLSLEAEASTYGKYIHEDGCISRARQDLIEVLANPKSVSENGRDTIIYDYIPTVKLDDVEQLYFSLQAHQREVQAELNGMKKRIKDTIDSQKLEADEEYHLAYRKWNDTMSAMNAELQLIAEDDSIQRKKMLADIQNLKIVVPHRLEKVVTYLNNL